MAENIHFRVMSNVITYKHCRVRTPAHTCRLLHFLPFVVASRNFLITKFSVFSLCVIWHDKGMTLDVFNSP